jgi:hypothetical protein
MDMKYGAKMGMTQLTQSGTWAEVGLLEKMFIERGTIHRCSRDGELRKGLSFEAILEEIKYVMGGGHFGVRVAVQFHSLRKDVSDAITVVAEDSVVSLSYLGASRGISIEVWSLRASVCTVFMNKLKLWIVRKATVGRVFAVVQGSEGPYLHEMGFAGETFIPDNYRNEVVTEYRHVVKDLNNNDPCGRIIILDGPPGTGKTHMVRALLNEVPHGTFVLVPSNMVSSLSTPGFVKAILHRQRKGFPMVLVVEDADECLASRKADNISGISALLNLSDGIFGSLMDLRIVCTTNVEIEELDPAVMRAGRLCRRVEVGKLDLDQATKVLARLTDKVGFAANTRQKFWTLGEIYRLARDGGRYQARSIKPTLGFGFAPEPQLQPGDVITTETGEIQAVDSDGNVVTIGNDTPQGAILTDDFEGYSEGQGQGSVTDGLDDDDLIDEDPED